MAESTGPGARVVVVNPASGSGDHGPQVSMLADEHGFEVLESGEPGEAVALAERAAPDASLVAACGGDGTVNEVVRGLRRADALPGTTFGVVPAGTGNNFAEKIGVESIPQSFDVLVEGETRWIDIGVASASARSTAAPGSSGSSAESQTSGAESQTSGAESAESTDESAEPSHEPAVSSEDDPSWDGGVELSTDGVRPAPDADRTRPFVNSCVCGITADASVSTSHGQKDRLGTLAYVVNTLQEAQEFDPIPLHVETHDGTSAPATWPTGTAGTSDAVDRTDAGDESGTPPDGGVGPDGRTDADRGAGTDGGAGTAWSGEAVAVLVGNGRRFPASGSAQADMEDGLLEVTILEDRPALDLMGEEARRRLLDAEGDHITRLRTSTLTLSVRRPEPTAFSLDGEMIEADRLEVGVEPRCLDLKVGAGYEPHPDG